MGVYGRMAGAPAEPTGAIRCLLGALAGLLIASGSASAQDSVRILELHFTPTGRAQIALWVETAEGDFVDTIRLTQATAYRGIGNRPGATLMNSGFRWPYGRREGALPVWGHRRAAAPGADMFPRVVFQDRTSEGFASRTAADYSRDDYFCLSFNADTTRREALDAVSCASVFNSDKGRYMGPDDVARGYAEPWEEPGGTSLMRPMPLHSLYPPRRDVTRCTGTGCVDHEDVDRFAEDARRVMPNIDAVTMATPQADIPQHILFDVPPEWPDGDYRALIEVNVEGDYNASFNDTTRPTPHGPGGQWDFWAESYGYAYRGQPSVVYGVPFRISGPGTFSSAGPAGHGALEGLDGTLHPMGATITDDPEAAPGSGADRLRLQTDGSRLRVVVIATNVCLGPEPPPECGTECDDARPCADGFLCAPGNTCIGYCDMEMRPPAVGDLEVASHADEKHSHEWARLRFRVPDHGRRLSRYEVRVSNRPIVDPSSFMRALPANAASIDSLELLVPTDGGPGELVEVDLGGLLPEVHYWVAVRPIDSCNDAGDFVVAELTTTEIHFTTVSPCYVATAAWGTPLASEVGALRRFRDRHLMPSAAGRAVVSSYYTVGPLAADLIRRHALLRAAARVNLRPLVALARWLEPDP